MLFKRKINNEEIIEKMCRLYIMDRKICMLKIIRAFKAADIDMKTEIRNGHKKQLMDIIIPLESTEILRYYVRIMKDFDVYEISSLIRNNIRILLLEQIYTANEINTITSMQDKFHSQYLSGIFKGIVDDNALFRGFYLEPFCRIILNSEKADLFILVLRILTCNVMEYTLKHGFSEYEKNSLILIPS